MKLNYTICVSAVALAFAATGAIAQPSPEVKQDKAQMKSDKTAGKMAAES